MVTLKRFLQSVGFPLVDRLIRPSKTITPKSLLIVRLDAIGDYILFRNFIEILKRSERYSGYSITLLGNAAWKELAEKLDGEFIDHFMWIERDKFAKNLLYRYRSLRQIASRGYETVISPAYSRRLFFSDNVVKLVSAREKIGSRGDGAGMTTRQKRISDAYYTKLIDARSVPLFEFDRNREFFENLLEAAPDIPRPSIRLQQKVLPARLPRKYALLFIGGSERFRKWDIENVAALGGYLRQRYGYEIVVSGAKSDREDALKFKNRYKGRYTDLVGRTSLAELLGVIDGASLMVSNESSAPHLVVALGIPDIFVISNGNHFGRFIPYPDAMAPNYHPIFPPEIDVSPHRYREMCDRYGPGSTLDINAVSVDTVIKTIDEILRVKYDDAVPSHNTPDPNAGNAYDE